MMDLSAILAELKTIEDFKQPDKVLATSLYCEKACKILDKVVNNAVNAEFTELVVGIWIVIGSFNEVLRHLQDGPFLTNFINKLFRQCARVVLDIKWQQLDENDASRQNFQASLLTCHQQIAPQGFSRFGVLQGLMDNAWTDPVLTMIMGSEDDNDEGEGLTYIQAQDPEILKLRVELMQQENCDDFALNLCSWCLKHPALAGDISVRKTQFLLFHHLNFMDRLQEECQSMSIEDSIRLITSLQDKEEHKELCIKVAQLCLVHNWINFLDNAATKELLRLWIKLQHQADQDQDRFISSLWAVAKVSRSTEQLLFIIDAVREQCGDAFLQFYTDLCVFAINVDKGCWEKLKESSTSGPNEEILARKRDMAKVCDKLAHIVSHVSPKISFCCALTAFAMLPSEEGLQSLRLAHQRKGRAEHVHGNQCCSNCASQQGTCLKNADSDKASRDVNIATLYEVERLCNMLRPAYLSPDSDLSILLTMCKQYLMKENGEAVKSALVRPGTNKIHPPASMPVRQFSSTAVNTNPPVALKPNILRGSASPIKLVDSGANVSNIAMPQTVTEAAATAFQPGGIQQGQGSGSGSPLLPQPGRRDAGTTPTPLPAQGLGDRAVGGAAFIQQMVLQQMSSDMVQTLLHLIQSGQVSPAQLNQIMTRNPSMFVQVLENLVTTKGNQDDPKPALDSAQQQHMQAQVEQKPAEHRTQNLQQQHSSQPRYSMPQGANAHLTVHQHIHHQQSANAGVRTVQQTAPSVAVQQQGVAQSMLVQQTPNRHRNPTPRQPGVAPPGQQPQAMVRPVRPMSAALRLSGTGEIHVTQPVHVMTLRPTAPLQSSVTGSRNQVYIHTNSQMLTHLSGGHVTTVQRPPQVLHLPSSSVTPTNPIGRPGQQAESKLISKAPTPKLAVHTTSTGPSTDVSSAAVGNRHYSINNLLFTGEPQNSTMSITLPDTLPEISVDTISDTLRAISDSSSGAGSQLTIPKAPLPQAQVQGPTLPQTQPHMTSLTARKAAPLASQKKKAAGKGKGKCQVSPAVAVTVPQQTTGLAGNLPVPPQPASNLEPGGQSLPSFSSLFTSSLQPLPVPAQTTPTVPAPAPQASHTAATPALPKKASAAQGKGQKKGVSGEKGANKGAKKGREAVAAEKEQMMKLLKQAMTINIEKKEDKEVAGTAYVHAQGQPFSSLAPSLASAPISTMPSAGAASQAMTMPSFLPGPQIHQASQLNTKVVSSAFPAQSSGQVLMNLAHQVPSPSATAISQAAARIPSLTTPSTMVQMNNVIPAIPSRMPSQFPPFTMSSSASSKIQNVMALKKEDLQGNGLKTKPSSSAIFDAVATSSSTGQRESAAIGHSNLPGSLGSTIIAPPVTVGNSGATRTYPRQEMVGELASVWTGSSDSVVCTPIPPGILPEGGIMETGRDGDQSIATYRCIICAKAFMTLDALRLHVRQICKPGLSQPGTLGDRMAINKAQATEAGLETSTVFQCMRCFELCISEAGIREHKAVCSKLPKAKNKAKSKAKPKPPKSEEEQATEAKVMELLNKCLGENREKLLEENRALAAKQAASKKKGARKRPSCDMEVPGPTSSDVPNKKVKKEKTQPDMVPSNPMQDIPMQYADNTAVGNAPPPVTHIMGVNPFNVQMPVRSELSSMLPPSAEAASSVAPPQDGSIEAAQASSLCTTPAFTHFPPVQPPTDSANVTSEGPKPKPKRKYYPKKKKLPENASQESPAAGQESPAAGQNTAAKTPKVKKGGESEAKPARAKKPKKPAAPPPPKFKELSGSGGRSFFKCLNCGQTLCSMENFREHWLDCIKKKPLPVKPKRAPKEKKSRTDKASISSAENCEDAIVPSDVSVDMSETNPSMFINSSDMKAEVKDCSVDIGSKGIVENGSVGEMPAAFEADATEVLNELQVETTVEEEVITSVPHIKPSLVMLEKVEIHEKVMENSISSDREDKTNVTDFTSTLAQKTDSPSKGKRQQKSPSKRDSSSKGKKKGETHKDSKSPTKRAQKPQLGDSRYCSSCKRYFSRRIVLIQHLATLHVQPYKVRKVNDKATYICDMCEKVFPQYSQFMAHVGSHSQAIVKRFNEREFGTTSPTIKSDEQEDVPEDMKKQDCKDEDMNARHPSVSESEEILTDSGTDQSKPLEDNKRTFCRAAQKQALSKIYISSLGISTSNESFKRKLSSDEKETTEAKTKRSRSDTSESKENTAVEDTEEEEMTDECSKETWPEDAAVDTEATKGGSKAIQKASMETTLAPCPGQPSMSPICPENTGLPCTSPPIASPPITSNKPSFLDSFLNFVNNRSRKSTASPPTPFVKRRASSQDVGANEVTAPVVPNRRNSSCDRPGSPVALTTLLSPSAKLQSSVEKHSASEAKSYSGSEAGSPLKKKDKDYDNVYYYGRFEEQLTKQCKVVLGDRILKEPAEEPAKSLKKCSVYLGPKVNSADMVISAKLDADMMIPDHESKGLDSSQEQPEAFAGVDSDSQDNNSLQDGAGAGTTTVPQYLPPESGAYGVSHSQQVGSAESTVLGMGEVCVEATLSVVPRPRVRSMEADVTVRVKSEASQFAVLQTPMDSLPSSAALGGANVETATVSSVPLSDSEIAVQSSYQAAYSEFCSNNRTLLPSGSEPSTPASEQPSTPSYADSPQTASIGHFMELNDAKPVSDEQSAEDSPSVKIKDEDEEGGEMAKSFVEHENGPVGEDLRENNIPCELSQKNNVQQTGCLDSDCTPDIPVTANTNISNVEETVQGDQPEPSALSVPSDSKGEIDATAKLIPIVPSGTDLNTNLMAPQSKGVGQIQQELLKQIVKTDNVTPARDHVPCAELEPHSEAVQPVEMVQLTHFSQTQSVPGLVNDHQRTPSAYKNVYSVLSSSQNTGSCGSFETSQADSLSADNEEADKTLATTESSDSTDTERHSVCHEAEQCESGVDDVVETVSADVAEGPMPIDKSEIDQVVSSFINQPPVSEYSEKTKVCPEKSDCISELENSGDHNSSVCSSGNNEFQPCISDLAHASDGDDEIKDTDFCVSADQQDKGGVKGDGAGYFLPSNEKGNGSETAGVKSSILEETLNVPGVELNDEGIQQERSGYTAKEPVSLAETGKHSPSILSDLNEEQHPDLKGTPQADHPHSPESSEKEEMSRAVMEGDGEKPVQASHKPQSSTRPMSMMDFLQKSAFPVFQSASQSDPSSADWTCSETEATAAGQEDYASDSDDADDDVEDDMDTSNDRVNILSFHDDNQIVTTCRNSEATSAETDTVVVRSATKSDDDATPSVKSQSITSGHPLLQRALMGAPKSQTLDGLRARNLQKWSYSTPFTEPQDQIEGISSKPVYLPLKPQVPTASAQALTEKQSIVCEEQSAVSEEQSTVSEEQSTLCEEQQIASGGLLHLDDHSPASQEQPVSSSQQPHVERPLTCFHNFSMNGEEQNKPSVSDSCPSPMVTDGETLGEKSAVGQSVDSAASRKAADASSYLRQEKEATKSCDDTDPDSDLPELCIVPDPDAVVIRAREKKPETKEVRAKVAVVSAGGGNESPVIDTFIENHEVKVTNLKPKIPRRKPQSETGTYIARMEVNHSPKVKESEEEPTRKPLLGVKSLRSVHNPQPFVWEDEGGNGGMEARMERSLKAFRQKARLTPFSWDTDCMDKGSRGGESNVTSVMPVEQALPAVNETGTSDPNHSIEVDSKSDVKEEVHEKTSSTKNTSSLEQTETEKNDGEKESSFNHIKASDKKGNVKTEIKSESGNRTTTRRSRQITGNKQGLGSKKNSFQSAGGNVSSSKPCPETTEAGEKKSLASSGERGRLMTRSKEMHRASSTDKTLSSTPVRSSSRSRISQPIKTKVLRKSRSCDIEDHDPVHPSHKKSFPSLTNETQLKSVKAEIAVENKLCTATDVKTNTLEVTKQSAKTEDKISTRCSEKGQKSASLQKWRKKLSPAKSTDSKSGTAKGTISRGKIRRCLDSAAENSDSPSANVSLRSRHNSRTSQPDTDPKLPVGKTALNVDGQAIKRSTRSSESVGKEIITKSKTTPPNSSTASNLSHDVKPLPNTDSPAGARSLRSRDASPSTLEVQQTIDTPSSPKSLRKRDTTGSKTIDSQIADVAQDCARSGRKKTGNIQSTVQANGKADTTPPASMKKPGQAKKTVSSHMCTTPTSPVNKVAQSTPPLPSSTRSYNRGRSALSPSSTRKASAHPRKPLPASKPAEQQATSDKKEASELPPSSSFKTEKKDFAQTPSLRRKYRVGQGDSEYLGAMVRRRTQVSSWRKTGSLVKKTYLATKTPQFEIIRVEPLQANSAPDKQRKTRSSDKDMEPSPRTVHTRVSVDDLKPQSTECSKTVGDQKWSINRHFCTSEGKKKSSDASFPFSFQRARRKTQTK